MNKAEFDQVVGLAHLLEKYMPQIIGAGRSKSIGFSDEDKKVWDSYFETLIKPEILPDGKVFSTSGNDSKAGVGLDGRGYRDEFLQLLMQCYKYLYLALSSGRFFWSIAAGMCRMGRKMIRGRRIYGESYRTGKG